MSRGLQERPFAAAPKPQPQLADAPHPPAPIANGRFLDAAKLAPAGLPRILLRALQPLVERLFGFTGLWRLHQAAVLPPYSPVATTERALQSLGLAWSLDDLSQQELADVKGPLVLASNHPCGGIEFLALVQLLEKIRPGQWKFLANEMVCGIAGFQERFIPLDPLGRGASAARRNRRGLSAAYRHLQQGGALALFPAGRVSHRQAELEGAVADRPWSRHCLSLARRTKAHFACIHVEAANRSLFLRIPPKWPRLRALMLCRELTRPKTRHLQLSLAALHSPAHLETLARLPDGVARLRADCYLAADAALRSPTPHTRPTPQPEPLAAKLAAPESLQHELLGSQSQRLLCYGPFELFLARGDAAPHVLHALGCARETTFRAAGQGTGSDCDLSTEDSYYHHLLLWDPSQQRLAGAYRIGIIQQIIAERGPSGLYLDHVFKIDPRLYQELGPAFELSRSFVHPDYQGDRHALAGLWKGLGAAATQLGIRTLFGSVTISNAHHPASRAVLVEHLQSHYADTASLRAKVQPRQPFVPETRYHRLVAAAYRGEPIGSLSTLIQRLEAGQRDIPPLLRYYCSLGARFLSFHVEASFQNALYCLLRVELERVPDAYKRRFLPSVSASRDPPASEMGFNSALSE